MNLANVLSDDRVEGTSDIHAATILEINAPTLGRFGKQIDRRANNLASLLSA